MGRLESLRERLPSLYRPETDDVDAEPRPLVPADVVEVLGEQPVPFVVRARSDGALIVRLDGPPPGPVRAITLAPGAVPGPGWALELHRVREDGSMVPKPALVADVRDSTVTLPGLFEERRFGILLRRRPLLTLALVGTADALDRLSLDAALVLQAHWSPFADRAVFDPFFLRGQELHEPPLPSPAPDDPAVLDFPYILDLGRLASLVSLPPWQTAATGNGDGPGESVEAYRQRIRRIVTLYADGLGTVDALRRMTEAQLPVDLDATAEKRDRPFAIEENAPLVSAQLAVQTPGRAGRPRRPAHALARDERRRRGGRVDPLRAGADRGRAGGGVERLRARGGGSVPRCRAFRPAGARARCGDRLCRHDS